MRYPERMARVSESEATETVAVVTGATDGVGRDIAMALGRLGATVYAHGRSPDKVHSLESDLRETDAPDVAVVQADFTDLDEVRHLASRIESETDRLDVLFNNAGAFFATGELTDLGVERTIAVNHLAPFVLSNRLQPLIEGSDGRIVTTSSAIHYRGDFDVDSFESVAGYDGMTAYANSKFANVLFTFALARRLEGATTTCFHPGFIPESGLYRHGSRPVRWFMRSLQALPNVLTSRFVSEPAHGAAAALYLGLSPDTANQNGGYFDGMERADPASETREEALQERLWEWSEKVVERAEG